MHKTKLLEFKNKKGNLLRGVFIEPKKFNKCIIFIHGFERTAITEKKFKVLADKLAKKNIASFRFDFTGCGLSDGDFKYTTIKNQVGDFTKALNKIKKVIRQPSDKNISVIAHSMGACILAKYIKTSKNIFGNIVLLSPALNQAELLRYWFTKSQNPKKKIAWKNYKKHLNEKAFMKDCERSDKMTKANYIAKNYFLENKNKDYSDIFTNLKNTLCVHGDKDDKAPIENVSINFVNKILVKGGDHDLERPDIIKQWLNKVIKFIK